MAPSASSKPLKATSSRPALKNGTLDSWFKAATSSPATPNQSRPQGSSSSTQPSATSTPGVSTAGSSNASSSRASSSVASSATAGSSGSASKPVLAKSVSNPVPKRDATNSSISPGKPTSSGTRPARRQSVDDDDDPDYTMARGDTLDPSTPRRGTRASTRLRSQSPLIGTASTLTLIGTSASKPRPSPSATKKGSASRRADQGSPSTSRTPSRRRVASTSSSSEEDVPEFPRKRPATVELEPIRELAVETSGEQSPAAFKDKGKGKAVDTDDYLMRSSEDTARPAIEDDDAVLPSSVPAEDDMELDEFSAERPGQVSSSQSTVKADGIAVPASEEGEEEQLVNAVHQALPSPAHRVRESRYTRSPSGSPLSSLPPSPVPHPKITRQGPPPRRRASYKQPHFAVVIPVKPTMRLPKWEGGIGSKARRASTPSDAASTPKATESANGNLSSSSLSAVDSDSDGDQSSDSESDDDDALEALIAGAKARIKEGTALVVTKVTPEVESPEVRRSARIPVVAEKAKEVDTSVTFMEGLSTDRGKFGFTALVKNNPERKAERDRIQARFAMLEEDDDLLRDSDDEDMPPSRGSVPPNRVGQLVANAYGAADDGQVLKSPEKRKAAQNEAQMIEILEEDQRRQKQIDDSIERRRLEVEHRRIWGIVIVPKLPSWPETEGWKGSIAKALNAAANGTPLPPAISLFSPLRYSGDVEEVLEVASWLLDFIGHPHPEATDCESAEGAIKLLARIANRVIEPLLSAARIQEKLVALGAAPLATVSTSGVGGSAALSPEAADDDDNGVDTESIEIDGGEAPSSVDEVSRNMAVKRLLVVIRNLCGSPSERIPEQDASLLIICLTMVAVDATSASLRYAIELTLSRLSEMLPKTNLHRSTYRRTLFMHLVHRFRPAPVQTRLQVLRVLPINSILDKWLVSWLAWAFLVDSKKDIAVIFSNLCLDAHPENLPPLEHLMDRLDPAINGPLTFYQKMDDSAFIAHAELLQTVLLNQSAVMEAEYSLSVTEKRFTKKTRDLQQAVKALESRIRAKIPGDNPSRFRAKGVVDRIRISLEFQIRAATHTEGKVEYSDGEEDDDANAAAGGKGLGKKPKQRAPREQGQMPLRFGPPAKK